MALKWNHPPLAFAWCSLLSYILYTYFSVGSNRHPMFDGWLAGWLAVAGLRASFWRSPVSLCVYCCVDRSSIRTNGTHLQRFGLSPKRRRSISNAYSETRQFPMNFVFK